VRLTTPSLVSAIFLNFGDGLLESLRIFDPHLIDLAKGDCVVKHIGRLPVVFTLGVMVSMPAVRSSAFTRRTG